MFASSWISYYILKIILEAIGHARAPLIQGRLDELADLAHVYFNLLRLLELLLDALKCLIDVLSLGRLKFFLDIINYLPLTFIIDFSAIRLLRVRVILLALRRLIQKHGLLGLIRHITGQINPRILPPSTVRITTGCILRFLGAKVNSRLQIVVERGNSLLLALFWGEYSVPLVQMQIFLEFLLLVCGLELLIEVLIVQEVIYGYVPLEAADPGTCQDGAHESGNTSCQVDDTSSRIVLEAQVLQPAVFPAPCQDGRENEGGGQECEEDVSVQGSSLSNRPRGDRRHHDAQAVI